MPDTLILRGMCMRKIISLGGGEPEYRTPDHIVEAMKEALDEGRTHYGDFKHIPEFREAIASYYKRMGVKADPDFVIVTPGSTMGIYMALRVLVGLGNDIITMDPCFFAYRSTMRNIGCNPVRLYRYKDEGWGIHLEDLEETYTPKTKAILICSPDNPTGYVFGKEELKGIAEFAEEKDIMVISDDIYSEITYDGVQFTSIASIPNMRDRTVILNGLSKAYAMTGWRVGYVITPDEDLYNRFHDIQLATYLVLNAAVQRASVAALTGPQDQVREMVTGYEEKRRLVMDAYEEIPDVSFVKPKGAFYLFPDMSAYEKNSRKLVQYIRDEAGVAVTPGVLFGSNGEGHFRQAFAQSKEDLEEGIDRIKQALKKLKR